MEAGLEKEPYKKETEKRIVQTRIGQRKTTVDRSQLVKRREMGVEKSDLVDENVAHVALNRRNQGKKVPDFAPFRGSLFIYQFQHTFSQKPLSYSF